MAKKQKRLAQVATTSAEAKASARYQDPFQQTVNARLEQVEKKVSGKGRTILYAIAALVVVAILFFIINSYNRRSEGAAQAALGKAIETSQSRVSDTPPLAGSKDQVFKTEKERAEKAIAEFQAVADKFGGSVAETARYFIATNKLSVDRAAGIAELEGIAGGSSASAGLAKFALAQTRHADGRLDDAAKLFGELAADNNSTLAKDTINLELAKVYEKQGKKDEAANLYFTIAKTANDAKDAEGQSVPMSQAATEAKKKIDELDPERAKEIVEQAAPFGG